MTSPEATSMEIDEVQIIRGRGCMLDKLLKTLTMMVTV